MLQSATQLSVNTPKTDEEMIDYNNTLRNGIFEAYAGLLQGFKDDKSRLPSSCRRGVCAGFRGDGEPGRRPRRHRLTRAMVGVMGDMADTMEGIGQLYAQKPFWKQLLQECINDEDEQLRETARWAQVAILMRTGGM